MLSDDDSMIIDDERTVFDKETKPDDDVGMTGWKKVRLLGTGSYGKVYEIIKEDGLGGQSRSALKIITIPHTPDEYESLRVDGYDDASITCIFRSQVEDITKEFRTMEKFKGVSNVVSCEDLQIVEHEDRRGWDILIRMELLTPLKEFYRKNGGMSEPQIKKLGEDICCALELCAKEKIIHRDIKPENIFINEHGDFKLGDFGIARTLNGDISAPTAATKIGSAPYMAPEVYHAIPYSGSVDIYSLGLVLYWLLNRRRGPFLPLPPEHPEMEDLTYATVRRMRGDMLPPPADGSAQLKSTVLKACAYSPADRFDSPRSMREALEGKRADTDFSKRKKPNKRLLIAAAGLVAAAALIAVVFAMFPKKDKTALSASVFEENSPKVSINIDSVDINDYTDTACLKTELADGGVLITGFVYGQETDVLNINEKYGEYTVVGISDGAFQYVDALEYVRLPDSVVSLGDDAFNGCASLKNVYIPDSVENIGSGAFYGCKSLNVVETEKGALKEIGDKAFYGCTSLETFTLYDGLVSIGECAFYDCSAIRSLSFPESLRSLGESAFSGCNSLSSVEIPYGVSLVPYMCFYGCGSLDTVILQYGVDSVEQSAFSACDSVKEVFIPSSVAVCDGLPKSDDIAYYVQKDSTAEAWAAEEGLLTAISFYTPKINPILLPEVTADTSVEEAVAAGESVHAVVKAPSDADLSAIGSTIHYPNSSEYLAESYTATIAAPRGNEVYAFIDPTEKLNGKYFTVADGTEVTVIAAQEYYSCVIISSKSRAGWINNDYLIRN